MRTVNALRRVHVRSIHVVIHPEQAICSDHACSAQMLGVAKSVRNKFQLQILRFY